VRRNTKHENDRTDDRHGLASTPEGKLWLAVLEQAVQELRDSAAELAQRVNTKTRHLKCMYTARKKGTELETPAEARDRAILLVERVEACRRFLNAPVEISHFQFACEVNDVDPVFIRAAARRTLRVTQFSERKRIVERGRRRVYPKIERRYMRLASKEEEHEEERDREGVHLEGDRGAACAEGAAEGSTPASGSCDRGAGAPEAPLCVEPEGSPGPDCGEQAALGGVPGAEGELAPALQVSMSTLRDTERSQCDPCWPGQGVA
jgi:hypothetical protein